MTAGAINLSIELSDETVALIEDINMQIRNNPQLTYDLDGALGPVIEDNVKNEIEDEIRRVYEMFAKHLDEPPAIANRKLELFPYLLGGTHRIISKWKLNVLG